MNERGLAIRKLIARWVAISERRERERRHRKPKPFVEMFRLLCVLWVIIFIVGVAKEYFAYGKGTVRKKYTKVVYSGGKGGSFPTTRHYVLLDIGQRRGEEMVIPERL